MADILTRAQLEDALTSLYQRFQDEPQAFDGYGDPRQDALAIAASILTS